ncbi:ribonuclease III [Kordiimonas aestuarii]|uniref:ribonuclease III n=1 Tax=Kordiimonas aestuarii TaxID=1005925 RepID=UPI0021D1ED0D|nr:ribonuclease III [Kordiimonas aestuarii]
MSGLKTIAGYTFQKESYLEEALTHPSLSGTHNYQRLEFLGDRVLGLVIATWLLESYPGEAEGKLNRRFTALVRRETLADMACKLGLAKEMLLTPGAEAEGTRDKEAIQSDITEAVIGAMYLDGGFEVANAFIRKHWAPLMKDGPSAFKDCKTLLQEWCQARGLPLPYYKMVERTGPDHNPEFTIAALVENKGEAVATGPAKRQAEQAAAGALLDKLVGESK